MSVRLIVPLMTQSSILVRKIGACCIAFILAGCGVQVQPYALQPVGRVMGGQQGIAGASIQLYAVGTTGDGSASTSLLNTPVTTDNNGYYSIFGKFTCPAPETLTYITATGGNPGLSGTLATNPNLALMAAIGRCDTAAVLNPIIINEVTTVAAVDALVPYMTSRTSVGSAAAHAGSLQFSFSNAAELARLDQGTSPGVFVAQNDRVPFVVLDTLANTVASCVNSPGGTPGDGSPCGQLFSLTGASAAPSLTTTIDALLALTANPTQNTVSLYNLAAAASPFQPQLSLPPIDFGIGVYHPVTIQVLPVAGLIYPNQQVGTSSTAQTVTIYNSGSTAVPVTSIMVSGADASDFGVTGSCTITLNPSDSCLLRILFSPTATGRRTAYLSVTTSGTPSNPSALPLQGNAN